MSARPRRFPATHWRAADYEAQREAKTCFYDSEIDWPAWDASHQGRNFDVPARRLPWLDSVFAIVLGLVLCGLALAAFGVLTK